MGKYDDLLPLPHHRSETHRHLTMHERAAQFAPFAVLAGLDEVLQTARMENEARQDVLQTEKEE